MYTFFIATVLVFSFFFPGGRGGSVTSSIVKDVEDIERLFLDGEKRENIAKFLKDPNNWENQLGDSFVRDPTGSKDVIIEVEKIFTPGKGHLIEVKIGYDVNEWNKIQELTDLDKAGSSMYKSEIFNEGAFLITVQEYVKRFAKFLNAYDNVVKNGKLTHFFTFESYRQVC